MSTFDEINHKFFVSHLEIFSPVFDKVNLKDAVVTFQERDLSSLYRQDQRNFFTSMKARGGNSRHFRLFRFSRQCLDFDFLQNPSLNRERCSDIFASAIFCVTIRKSSFYTDLCFKEIKIWTERSVESSLLRFKTLFKNIMSINAREKEKKEGFYQKK